MNRGGWEIEESLVVVVMDRFSHPPTSPTRTCIITIDEFHPAKRLLAYLPAEAPRPTVHCYCFSKAEDPTADALKVREGATAGNG